MPIPPQNNNQLFKIILMKAVAPDPEADSCEFSLRLTDLELGSYQVCDEMNVLSSGCDPLMSQLPQWVDQGFDVLVFYASSQRVLFARIEGRGEKKYLVSKSGEVQEVDESGLVSMGCNSESETSEIPYPEVVYRHGVTVD